MGTNYYIELDKCDKCGNVGRMYHVGKSSGGWCFSLHVDPNAGIHEIDDVIRLCASGKIIDEYNHEITSTELMNIITKRGWKDERIYGGVGERSKKEFLDKNSAVSGPNGLIRYKIDGIMCIGHGNGTWDLITGEFS